MPASAQPARTFWICSISSTGWEVYCSYSSSVTKPSRFMSASTSLRRFSPASGWATGSYWFGPLVMPARSAASPGLRSFALLEK